MKPDIRLDWRPWVDMDGVSSVCVVSDQGNFHYDPNNETVRQVASPLEDRYDIIYIDSALKHSESLGAITKSYEPYLSEAGTLVFKPADFGWPRRRPTRAGSIPGRLGSLLRLPLAVLKAARRLPRRGLAWVTRQIYVYPRDGSLLMSEHLPLLLRHVRDEGRSGRVVRAGLSLLLRVGLDRRWPQLWPFRYTVVSRSL